MAGVIAVVGATATGKTRLALELAEALDGEIVNADSRQVYSYMDIGTAKPLPEERARARHHLIDFLDPDEPFNLALYLELATRAVEDIRSRGKLPLLVGGSGLYVWGFLEGHTVPRVPPDYALRKNLELQGKMLGPQALHDRLRELDPEAADSISPSNLRRIIRALEVCQKSGAPFSSQAAKAGLDYPFIVIGLKAPRQTLYQRIDLRVDEMVRRGLVDEVRGLMQRGYGLDLPSMSSVGYRQIGMYLQGELSLEEAVERTKHGTHRLARRQGAWFRLGDERIHWYDITKEFSGAVMCEAARFCCEGPS